MWPSRKLAWLSVALHPPCSLGEDIKKCGQKVCLGTFSEQLSWNKNFSSPTFCWNLNISPDIQKLTYFLLDGNSYLCLNLIVQLLSLYLPETETEWNILKVRYYLLLNYSLKKWKQPAIQEKRKKTPLGENNIALPGCIRMTKKGVLLTGRILF